MQPSVAGSSLRNGLACGSAPAGAVLLGGCLLPPTPKTDAGQDVFNLYIVVLVLAGIVFIAVEGFILYAVVRYRRSPGDDVLPEQLHGNTTVEIIWTLIPTVIVFILFGFSMVTLGEVEARAEEPGVTIQVDGFQWQWSFTYPEGVTVTGTEEEPPTLYVPVNEPVRLVLASLDVNHAIFVPDFLLKRDVIRYADDTQHNELEFTVTEAGTYAGQCAEFCGTAHADMIFVVEALPARTTTLRSRPWPAASRRRRPPVSARPLSSSPPSSRSNSTRTRSRRRRVRTSASSSRTTTRCRTMSASSRPTSTATTYSPASRSRT